MTKSLDGRIALVTGGSRGIGRGIALRLAHDGCTVVAFTYNADEAAARRTASEIEAAGADAIAIRAGLEEADQVGVLFRALDAELSDLTGDTRFDILVTNAGAGGWGSLATATPEEFDRVFATSVRGPFFVIQAAMDRLRDGGRVVNISSVPSTHPSATSPVCSMSKAAVNAMTEIAAAELGKRGITVNSVAPGWTATDADARRNPAGAEQIAPCTGAGRTAEPADIAGVVALFVSPDAAWLTGQHVDANGRWNRP